MGKTLFAGLCHPICFKAHDNHCTVSVFREKYGAAIADDILIFKIYIIFYTILLGNNKKL